MPEESADLEGLKAKINDPALPTLDLARALETHRTTYSHSHRTLAEKLEMPERRTYLSEVIGLLKLPPSELEKLEGQVLSRRAIQKLQSVDQNRPEVDQTVVQPKTAVDRVDQSVDQRRPAVDQGVDHVDQTVDQSKNRVDRVKSAVDKPTPSYPPIRETVDELVKL